MANIKLDQLSREIEKALKDVQKKEVDKLGSETVSAMKDLISKGISPIAKEGRFPAYKKPYPKSANYRYPNKKSRPVNLHLSGDFLKNLKFQVRGSAPDYTIVVGFTDPLSSAKEKGHREGANGQAKRPIIPQGSETFAKSIQDLILKTFRDVLEKTLNKKIGGKQ